MALNILVFLVLARWQASTADPISFECSTGANNWVMGWSNQKKQYCCQSVGVGCEATTTTLCHQDCQAGLSNWELGWSKYKKEWCCKHEGLGCSPTTTTQPYDCNAEYSDWLLKWSVGKKTWCCKNKGLGCPTTTTSCHVDCHVGLNNWEKGWAQWKKDYCCKHEQLGCPPARRVQATTTTTSCPIDCHAGLDNWEAGWGSWKKEWCCKHKQLGCPSTTTITTTVSFTTVSTTTTTQTSTVTTTTTLPYDCRYLGGFWSHEKADWCCKNEKRGCTTITETSTQTTTTVTTGTSTSTLPYDCSSGYTTCYHCLERRWPFAKRTWCCNHAGRGCPTTRTLTTTTTTTYDCAAEYPAAVDEWSMEKRSWCCEHARTGCTTTTATATTTTTTYDCSLPIAMEGESALLPWSAEQRAWCCSHTGHGCTTTITATTTTPPPYNCMSHLDSWVHWPIDKKEWCCKHEKQGCPTTVTITTTTRTTRHVPHSEVMTCDLNCFGMGGQVVTLPGSLGAGSGASLNDVPLQECRNVCAATEGCEAVLFTNRTRGVPWKSMCFGKRDIHTSKCQPGGAYLTDVLVSSRPWGKCAVFGDPHVITWDRVYGPPITMTDPGDYYLVKSATLTIHGRFGYTHRFPTASSTVGIAVSGPLIKDHTLVVTYVGPEQGYKGFRVIWDGEIILSEYPSHFNSKDGVLRATHDAMDPQKYHREGRHTIGGTSGLLPSYYFQFSPDLNVYVLLGPDNCNAVIETRKVDGPQDGYCGNFNCVKEDDSLEALRTRGMMGTIPEAESLFRYAPKPPAWVLDKVKTPSMKDCNPAVKARAMNECRGLPNGEEAACIFDACAANRTAVAAEDIGVMALPFNCQQGLPHTWAAEKQRWCCKREKVGCLPNQRAPPNHKAAAQTDHLQGCKSICSFQGQSASCFARIQWAAQHTYLGKEKPCLKAHKLVLSQCASCSSCTTEALGCTGRADDKGPGMVFFKRRYEDQPLDLEQPVPRGTSGIATLLAGAAGAAGLAAAALALGRRAGRRAAAAGGAAQDVPEHAMLLDSEQGAQ